MRWFWIDRFTEFVSGTCAVAVKNVSLAEEHVCDAARSHPYLAPSLIIEGIAQTAGILIAEQGKYEERVVLAKISKSVFHCLARPGDTLTYSVTILQTDPKGASVTAESHIGDKLQAQVDLFFAHLDDRDDDRDLYHPYDLACMIQAWGVYDVGVDTDGNRLELPPLFAEASNPSLTSE